jgi:hypothetical protein
MCRRRLADDEHSGGDTRLAGVHARYFPQRRRHDFEVLKAYEAYRNGSTVREWLPSEDRTPSGAALQVWEGEGGAVTAGGKEKARENGRSLLLQGVGRV